MRRSRVCSSPIISKNDVPKPAALLRAEHNGTTILMIPSRSDNNPKSAPILNYRKKKSPAPGGDDFMVA